MDMTMRLNYDMNLFYDFVTSTFLSLWPILVPAIAIGLVVMLVGGIMKILDMVKYR